MRATRRHARGPRRARVPLDEVTVSSGSCRSSRAGGASRSTCGSGTGGSTGPPTSPAARAASRPPSRGSTSPARAAPPGVRLELVGTPPAGPTCRPGRAGAGPRARRAHGEGGGRRRRPAAAAGDGVAPDAPPGGLGALAAQVVLADGKGTFEKLAARGGDAELAGDGLYFAPQPRLACAPLYGKARVRSGRLPRPGNARSGALELALRATAALAQSKGSHGAQARARRRAVVHPPGPPAGGR